MDGNNDRNKTYLTEQKENFTYAWELSEAVKADIDEIRKCAADKLIAVICACDFGFEVRTIFSTVLGMDIDIMETEEMIPVVEEANTGDDLFFFEKPAKNAPPQLYRASLERKITEEERDALVEEFHRNLANDPEKRGILLASTLTEPDNSLPAGALNELKSRFEALKPQLSHALAAEIEELFENYNREAELNSN